MTTFEGKIKGKAWKFGDNVDTDAIIPGKYLVINQSKELAKHAFENVRPEFATRVKKGDIIVAGENFGSGSSREHAPLALKENVSIIIAKSFARIFFRNAINIGLPVLETDTTEIAEGDTLEVDLAKGIIFDKTKNKTFEVSELPIFVRRIIESGGLVNYVREHVLQEEEHTQRQTELEME
jgi:3-isopropylmalate/(R)-2-methylmalate dehydratase small subunit